MKKALIKLNMTRFLLWTSIPLVLFSCKQRDDYPVFFPQEVEVPPKDTIPYDNTIESITKLIIDKTDVIGTFKMDSTENLTDGISRTHVRFLNRIGQLMSMQILQVDLSKPNLTAIGLSPYDDYLSTTQTMSDMAKYNEKRSGGQIVAAINGDVSSSGVPTGSFIKLGRKIRTVTTTANANTRPFFAVKYDGSPIIGNRPNAEFTLDPYDLNDFKYLVSGSSWLVYKGNIIPNTLTTVQANTAIGLGSNKKLFAVVVDGGNNAFSVGIVNNDMSKIMSALGCIDAFSTNVGTSSVMVQRSVSDDKVNPVVWKVVNKPSTATGAASANGIGFVLK